MFKFKITPDRHNAIQKLNYCAVPHPAHFSLPSTFKCACGGFNIALLKMGVLVKTMKVGIESLTVLVED
jgi:hypothetical protein